MDEFRIWSYARSEEEIINNRYRDLSGNENGLELYFNFNQGVPNGNNTCFTQIFDKSRNELHGGFVSFAKDGDKSNLVSSDLDVFTFDNFCLQNCIELCEGCSDTCTDTIPPNCATFPTVVSLGTSGTFEIDPFLVDGGSNDECSEVSLSLSKTSFDCSDLGLDFGIAIVDLLVTDDSNNTSSCTCLLYTSPSPRDRG